MKILLLGEYSGFYRNLADGLNAIGVEAQLCGSKDGFKNIPVDISLDSKFGGLLGKIHNRVIPFSKQSKLKNFDIVQLVNPFVFRNNYFPDKYFINKIIDSNKSFFMSAAGCDAYVWKNSRPKLRYGYFDDFLKYDLKSESFYMETQSSYDFNTYVLGRAQGVIPVMYEYELAYLNSNKLLKTIPLPVNTDQIRFEELNKLSGKITILHGLNRYGFKGTRHVEAAFDILRKKYPNDLELIIAGNMPLNEYLELMRRTHIIIDQTNSYSLGMNGIFGLAQGKIVIGGAEKESLNSLGVTESPVINITPDFISIVEAVENIINQRNRIRDMSYESRLFAETVHGYKNIAKMYVDLWSKSI